MTDEQRKLKDLLAYLRANDIGVIKVKMYKHTAYITLATTVKVVADLETIKVSKLSIKRRNFYRQGSGWKTLTPLQLLKLKRNTNDSVEIW